MTTTLTPEPLTRAEVLHHAALRALRAPSVHNTQPWRFVVTDHALELRADRDRQLRVLDPRGRQLTISCGCALYNARVAIEAVGYTPIVERLPDPDDKDLLARVSVGSPHGYAHSVSLNLAIDERRTNRRAYASEPVPDDVLQDVIRIAAEEGGVLSVIDDLDERLAIAGLSAMADHIEREDPAYAEELARWTTDDPNRPDGVQAATVPNGGRKWSEQQRLPLRNMDPRGMGWLPPNVIDAADECLMLFGADDDTPLAWLRTGEALEHVWLELTDRFYWAGPLMQVIEVGLTRGQLQRTLGRGAEPQLLLRVGRAPSTVETQRRAPEDVIEVRAAGAELS